MKKLIFRYLFDNYYWYDNKLWSNPERRATVRSISDDLQLVFGLTEKQTKWYIKSWVRKQNKAFNFNAWWKRIYGIHYPLIRRLMARQISTDLVEVQPMSAPTVTLQYFGLNLENENVYEYAREPREVNYNEDVNSILHFFETLSNDR